jgi:hypothetical protein
LIFVITKAGACCDACSFMAAFTTLVASSFVVGFYWHHLFLLLNLGWWVFFLVDLLLLLQDVTEEKCALVKLLYLRLLFATELASEAAQCSFIKEDISDVGIAVDLLNVDTDVRYFALVIRVNLWEFLEKLRLQNRHEMAHYFVLCDTESILEDLDRLRLA